MKKSFIDSLYPRNFTKFKPAKSGNNILRNLMGDSDKDKVRNALDCQQRNRFRHGGEVFWQYLKQKGINIQTKPQYKKQIRRIYEKNPELIQKSQGLTIRDTADINFLAQYKPHNKEAIRTYAELRPIKRQEAVIYGRAYLNRGMLREDLAKHPDLSAEEKRKLDKQYQRDFVETNPAKTLRHELQHREDMQNMPAPELWEAKQQQTQLYQKQDTMTPRQRYIAYRKLRLEKRAFKTQEQTPERDISVPESKRYKTYKQTMEQFDNEQKETNL